MSRIVLNADYARAMNKPRRIETPRITSIRVSDGHLGVPRYLEATTESGQVHRIRLDILEEVRI